MADQFWERYKHPKWQEKRLRILDRDNWVCCVCGEDCRESGESANVHHGYYERDKDPWEYDDSTLHTTCKQCHKAATSERYALQKLIGQINPAYYIEAAYLFDAILRWRDGELSIDDALFKILIFAGFISGRDDEADQVLIRLGISDSPPGRIDSDIALGMGVSV